MSVPHAHQASHGQPYGPYGPGAPRGPRPSQPGVPTLWAPARRYLATAALAVAAATGGYVGWLGDSGWQWWGPVVLVLATVPAISNGWSVWAPVVVGLALAGSLLTDREGTETLVVLPVVLGVVAVAELVGAADRLAVVLPRSPVPDLLRLVVMLMVGAAGSVLAVLLGSVGGPAGPAAVALAAAACVVLGLLLLRPQGPGTEGPRR